jgi:hypothetical protein
MGTSKGKGKYITPEKMWELFEQYKKEVKSNPRLKHVFVGKDGDSKEERLERPLTYEGFCVFMFPHITNTDDYFLNRDGRYEEYKTICSHIRNIIRGDQVEGGMVGQYNASITQRLNNLREQVDSKQEITQITIKRD